MRTTVLSYAVLMSFFPTLLDKSSSIHHQTIHLAADHRTLPVRTVTLSLFSCSIEKSKRAPGTFNTALTTFTVLPILCDTNSSTHQKLLCCYEIHSISHRVLIWMMYVNCHAVYLSYSSSLINTSHIVRAISINEQRFRPGDITGFWRPAAVLDKCEVA